MSTLQTSNEVFNPFLFMMEPKTVVRAMYRSADLKGLEHHVYRPLDRPWIPFTTEKRTVEGLAKPRAIPRLHS